MRHVETRKSPARTRILMMTTAVALMAASAAINSPAFADEAAAKKWIDSEFQPSTLSKDDQMKEMQWFIKAAAPFKGMEINAVSETLTVHEYESKTLAKAFEEITGIKVRHDIIQEGDVVEKIQTQMQSGKNVYDAWINDSDFIGTHFRYGQAVDLTEWMAGEGKDVTNPGLDVNDFIGKSFTTAPNGHLYQLPDQQFANLYWFRYDWFSNPDYKAKFKAKYGYDLGVPVNWSAYEDIAEFFTNDIKEINGVRDLRPYGLRQEGSLARMAIHRCVAVDGRQWRQGHSQRTSRRRMGHPHGRLPPGRLLGRTRRRRQRPGGGLLDRQISRLDEEVCPAASARHDLLRIGTGAGARQYRPADLLVHRLHRRHGEAGPCR